MNTRFGDMAELVECARLEIAYTGNRIEGSNPPISATNNKMSRWGIFLFVSSTSEFEPGKRVRTAAERQTEYAGEQRE